MKIVYVLGFLPTYVKREIETLANAGHEILVLLPSDESSNVTAGLWKSITGDTEKQLFETLGTIPFQFLVSPVVSLLKPFLLSVRYWLHIPRAIKEGEFRYFLTAAETMRSLPDIWKPDVIHTHFAKDQAHIARIIAKTIGVPYTVTTHATDIFVPQNIHRLKRVLADAGAVITISEYNSEYMNLRGFSTKRIAVIKLGISTEDLPERSIHADRQVGVCTASGLVEKKGVDVLLKASELLQKDYPELSIRVIGSDPGGLLLEEYRKKTENLPIEFAGVLSSREALREVSEASFFVLPCTRASNGDMDGIPVSIMEAMGIGVPVISTNISGIPELIEHGKCGFLAEPGSPESLAEMVRRILDSPREAEAMGKMGLDRVLSLHSPETAANALMNEFENLATGKQAEEWK